MSAEQEQWLLVGREIGWNGLTIRDPVVRTRDGDEFHALGQRAGDDGPVNQTFCRQEIDREHPADGLPHDAKPCPICYPPPA